MDTPKVKHVETSELASIVEKSLQALDFAERIRIATEVLIDHAVTEGNFGMRAETYDGTFRVTVRKEDK